MQIRSRKEAIELGLKRYFTGKPCKRSHVSERFVNKSTCVICQKERNKTLRVNSKIKAQTYKTYFTGKPCSRGHCSDRLTIDGSCVECNKISHTNRQRRFVSKDPEHVRAIVRKSFKKDYQQNPSKYVAKTAHRRAVKLKATPIWANLEEIKNFYANCPKGYQVDHIVPLQGENVCGLHVINNLQYLTAAQNASKKNKWTVDGPLN